MRQASEFKESSLKNGIYGWPIHNCSLCGYQCGYVISNDREHVSYDSGCDCVTYTNYQTRSWEDLANQYNIQDHPEVIKRMDEYWKFNPPATAEE